MQYSYRNSKSSPSLWVLKCFFIYSNPFVGAKVVNFTKKTFLFVISRAYFRQNLCPSEEQEPHLKDTNELIKQGILLG